MKHGILKSITFIAVILLLAACAENQETKQDVVFNLEDFNTFKQHMEAETLPEFFSTDGWKHIFPDLEAKPDVLAGLQRGENTIVARAGAGGSIFYLAVKTEMAESDDINPSDALTALEVPGKLSLNK